MITRVSMPTNVYNSYKQQNKNVSFGFAKLNSFGYECAPEFGLTTNNYLNSEMFKKPSFFDDISALGKEIKEGKDFIDICTKYGCSKDGERNAQFIVNQVLHRKSERAIDELPDEIYVKGITLLYAANFDNKNLKKEDTIKLLFLLKDKVSNKFYLENYGLIAAGASE